MKSNMALFCVLAVFSAAAAVNVNINLNTGSPVGKVVELLKDLKTKAEADGAAEQKIYDKYACWCENTTKRKAEGIVATLTAEIAELSSEIKKNQEAQDDATSVRTKENAAYMGKTSEGGTWTVALAFASPFP